MAAILGALSTNRKWQSSHVNLRIRNQNSIKMILMGSEPPLEPMSAYTLVERPNTISADLNRHDCIGVDTEFMREKTFFAELCLIQIATNDDIYCIDPLASDAMRSFWESATDRTWVVHSARQDIEVVYQTSQLMPKRIFDTQIAAGLLGYAPQLGYANLASELFGVEIAKSHTRADWSKRPLTDALLQYAAEDVEYLLPAYNALAERLDRQSRLAWAEEDSARLLSPDLYDIDPRLAIDRLKGARNLRGQRRSAAAGLATWRESQALRSNCPRQWVARDSVLIDLAFKLPASIEELQAIEGLAPGLIRRAGKTIIEIIALSDADDDHYKPPAVPDEAQKVLLKKMQNHVAECAADLGLAAETLASKKDLSGVIMSGAQDSRLLNGWRHEVIGEQILKLL